MKQTEVELIQYNVVVCPNCHNLKAEFKTFSSCTDELVLKCLSCGVEYSTGIFSKSGNDIFTVTFSDDEAIRGLETLLENELESK